MSTPLQWKTFGDFVQDHWLSALFLFLTLLTLFLLLTGRWWFRRRWKRLLEVEYDDEGELDALPPHDKKDEQTLELIRSFRREVWQLSDADLQLNIEALGQRATRIIASVAAIYHPATEVPQYQASLTELLQLVRRVSARLDRLGSVVPFKYLGNRKLSDYQRYYQIYRKINEHPVLQLLKRNPHLYRITRWALNVKNLANPLYWAGKEISRESYFYLLRWFYLAFTSQVGREAMRVYSGRQFHTEEEFEAALVSYRLFTLVQQWGGPSLSEWTAFVDFVTGHAGMEPEAKIQVLSLCSKNRLPKNLEKLDLKTRNGLKYYRQGLKRLQETDADPSSVKAALIERELTTLE